MNLGEYRVAAAIAVSDMERAVGFYEGVLGLTGEASPDGGRDYRCGGGTGLHVYPSAHAQASGATVAGWEVDDLDALVDELIDKGAAFEQYGEPFSTDARGVARFDGGASAWLKDPDGNVLSFGAYS